MGVLAWSLAAIVIVLIVALALPWRIRLVGRTSPPGGRLELGLLDGHAPAIRIPLGRRRARGARKRTEKAPKAKRRRRAGMPRGLGELVLGLLSAIRFGDVRLSGRIGLDDPAETGRVWGWLAPFVFTLQGPHRQFEISPDFSGRCLDLEGSAEIVLRPPRLVRAGLAFAWANRAGAS